MSETITKDKEFKDLVHVVREQQVMLDSELAELYGYEVKNFNRQVKNNQNRFPEDFRFQLTMQEAQAISRCKNCTLCFHRTRYLHVICCLKGELAIYC